MPIEIPSPNTTAPQSVAPQVYLHFSADGQVAVITIEANTKAALDGYEDTVQTLLRMWRLGEPLRLMHILTHPQVTLTPFARDRITETWAHLNRTTRLGRSAIVLDGVNTRWLAAVAQNAIRGANNVQQRIFFTQSEADTWVTG